MTPRWIITGRFGGVVRVLVFQLELLGQVLIGLDRGKRFLAAHHVLDLHVDLGAVERGLAIGFEERQAGFLQNAA